MQFISVLYSVHTSFTKELICSPGQKTGYCQEIIILVKAVARGPVPDLFLSLDTEWINFDHRLRCGGWLEVWYRISSMEARSGIILKEVSSRPGPDV